MPQGGPVTAQKLRFTGKDFKFIGQPRGLGFFGQHLWSSGKSIVITEGEIDCLSVGQAFGLKWPVVSLTNGASSAAKMVQEQYEWLDQFDKVVLCFDQDPAGRQASLEAAEALPMGKAYLMTILDYKDANEALIESGAECITQAYWNAKPWRPDGVIQGNSITRESLQFAQTKGLGLPYPALQALTQGIRKRELTMLTAGTGIGKSTLARELAYHLHQSHGQRIGNMYLEESVTKTAQGYVAIHNNVAMGDLRANPALLTDAQWDSGLSVIEGMYFYDHFGSLESERLLGKLKYMASGLQCDFIILDHISLVVSGQTGSGEGERRDIDKLMTRLRTLIEETGVGIIAIVHLNQPEGKPHEEGGRVTLSNLRGSGSLKQLSDTIIALERDQQDPEAGDICKARVLKNREYGTIGLADALYYNRATGRLVVTNMPQDKSQFKEKAKETHDSGGLDI